MFSSSSLSSTSKSSSSVLVGCNVNNNITNAEADEDYGRGCLVLGICAPNNDNNNNNNMIQNIHNNNGQNLDLRLASSSPSLSSSSQQKQQRQQQRQQPQPQQPQRSRFSRNSNTKSKKVPTSSSSSSSSSTSSDNNNNNNNNNIKDKVKSKDKLLIQELNDLTFEEREKVYEEIHGVVNTHSHKVHPETPEFITKCFEQLQDELAKIPRRKRRALDRAFFYKPSLQYDSKFLLMFLRCDNYNPILAAQRMGRYFTSKLELFGPDHLIKDITIDDMTENDMDCINRGVVHVSPEKDCAGRTILYSNVRQFQCKHWKNMTRCIWYQIMCAIQDDEETQIHGIVDICDCVGLDDVQTDITKFLSQGASYLGDLPLRFAAMHFCYDNVRFKPALSLLQVVMTRYIRLRFRIHFGSNMECLYALLTFGIPRRALPIHSDGKPVEGIHEQYVMKRQQIEKQQYQTYQQEELQRRRNEQLYDTPSLVDVVLGRGRPFQDFPGNRQLAILVNEQRQLHQNMDRPGKTKITMDIVKQIQYQFGGKFLQKTPRGWQQVDDSTAREKVSQTFRTKFTSTTTTTTSSSSLVSTTTAQDADFFSESEDLLGDSGRSKRIRYDDSLLLSLEEEEEEEDDSYV